MEFEHCNTIEMICELFDIAPNCISPKSRIREDLKIDGSDALILIQHIEDRFDVNFSALKKSWPKYFLTESEKLRLLAENSGWIALAIGAGVAAYIVIGPVSAGIPAIIISLFASGVQKRTISIGDIENAINRGFWKEN